VPARNASDSWGSVAKILHWLIALGVLTAAVVAKVSEELSSSRDRYEWMVSHKSLGLTLLALMLIRVAWRMSNPSPDLPASMPRWQRLAARLTHWGLYLVLLWMPITGWLAHSASGLPLKWFNWFKVPGLVGKDKALKGLAENLHEWGFWLLIALFIVHVAAALKHHFIERDDTLRKMWFGNRMTPPNAPRDLE